MGRAHLQILILLLFLLAGCVKDTPQPASVSTASSGNVFVVCEGSLGNGNATLYRYNSETDSVYGDLFYAVNHQSLGDIFQSMTLIDQHYFLCINNSDKIVVLNKNDLTISGTISIPKPRYIIPGAGTTAYVSALYSNKVFTINTATLAVTDSFTFPGTNTEEMYRYLDDIFVCTWDTTVNKLHRLSTATGTISQSINLPGYAPHSIVQDKEGMLWVLAGNVTKNRPTTLSRIDPSTGHVIATYLFPSNADAIKPAFNTAKDTLYFIEVKYDGTTTNNGIYRMDIHAAALPQSAFIAAGQYQYFWALGIDPATGNIFVGDPKGFIQKGAVNIYNPQGTLLHSFTTGLGPGAFLFAD